MAEHSRRHDPDQIIPPQSFCPSHAHSPCPGQAPERPLAGNVEPAPAAGPMTAPPEAPGRPGFWNSLTNVERAAFLASAEEVVYPVGAVLWQEGQNADHTIVIKSGSVRVSVERNGREHILAFRGTGDIVGERAALLLRRRSATIVAMDVLHALRLTTQQFVTFLNDHPRVVAVLEREMYDRLTEQAELHGPPLTAPYGHPYGYPRTLAAPYTATPPPWPQDPYAMYYAASHPCTTPHPYATPRPYAMVAAHAGGSAHPIASAAPTGTPSWAGQNCTIVYTDVAGFSSRARTDPDRLQVRRAMYRALQKAFEESRVPWDACHVEDRGDGALVVIPPDTPTAMVVDPMIALLGRRLRDHNHTSSEAVRVQLRVAIDVGPVLPDPPGVSGWAIIAAARLLDAAPLKERLAASRADLGVIASRFVYDSVIAHGPGHVNAAEYEPVSCRVKETDVEGWMHLRGLPAEAV